MNQKSSNLPTLCVFVPIHRENETLERTITEIIGQNQDNFVLEQVILVLDNSNNFCENIARKYAHEDSRFVIKKTSNQSGVQNITNEIFATCNADVLIRIDADTVFLSQNLFNSFVEEIHNGNSIIGTHYIHSREPETFLRFVDSYGFEVWEKIKWTSQKDTRVNKIIGSCVAYSKDIYQKIQIPVLDRLIADDTYITVRALELGFNVTSIDSGIAITLEKIDSLRHLISRYSRHQDTSYKSFFDKKFIQKIKPGLHKERMIELSKALLKHPVYISTYILIVIVSILNMKCTKRKNSSWSRSS